MATAAFLRPRNDQETLDHCGESGLQPLYIIELIPNSLRRFLQSGGFHPSCLWEHSPQLREWKLKECMSLTQCHEASVWSHKAGHVMLDFIPWERVSPMLSVQMLQGSKLLGSSSKFPQRHLLASSGPHLSYKERPTHPALCWLVPNAWWHTTDDWNSDLLVSFF